MLVVCTGGRDYNDFAMIQEVLGSFESIEKIYVGDASGADADVAHWCTLVKMPYQTFIADWDSYGKSAGPKRNRLMLDTALSELNEGEWEKVIVIAFPGGKGTENCVKEAVKRNMIVLRVEP